VVTRTPVAMLVAMLSLVTKLTMSATEILVPDEAPYMVRPVTAVVIAVSRYL
jgi:hypothetical protein